MSKVKRLRYTGRGCGAFLDGVPARDLSPDEVDKYGGLAALLSTGLYELEAEEEDNGHSIEKDPDREGDDPGHGG